MEGEADQVHRLIHYGPQHSVSAMVNSLKGFPAGYYEAQDLIWPTNTGREYFWSPSYLAATCGGAPIPPPQAVHRISEDTDLTESLISPPLKGERGFTLHRINPDPETEPHRRSSIP